MYRNKWHVICIIQTLFIFGLIFSKFIPIGLNDYYYIVNGQTYRYFSYSLAYIITIGLLMYDPFNLYVLMRIAESSKTEYLKNIMLPLTINVISTIFASIYGANVFSIKMNIVEVLYSYVSLINYQLFIFLIITVLISMTHKISRSCLYCLIIIFILNVAIFSNINKYDDIIIVMINLLLFSFWRCYEKNLFNSNFNDCDFTHIKH